MTVLWNDAQKTCWILNPFFLEREERERERERRERGGLGGGGGGGDSPELYIGFEGRDID